MPTDSQNILSGACDLIDEALPDTQTIGKAPHYKHKDACLKLKSRPEGFNADALIKRLYRRIEENWRTRRLQRNPSQENWRWKCCTEYKTKSLEVNREREMIKAHLESLKEGQLPRWANQIPVASGLLGSFSDKRRAVDLAHRCEVPEHHSDTCYALIELKIKSNTPLYAAFEILLYGLLFVFSRCNREVLKYDIVRQPLLWADRLHLRVLAPPGYYDKRSYKLDWLEKDLNKAISRFARRKAGVEMDFSFWECCDELPPATRDVPSAWLRYWELGKNVKW